MRDYGHEAQRAAELHLEACDLALCQEDDGAEDVTWPVMAAPFCGCQTCVVREVLYAAWPHLEAAALHEHEHEGVTDRAPYPSP